MTRPPGRDLRGELLARARAIPGVALSEGAFNAGEAVWVGRREIAHFDSGGELDVRLTRQVIRERRERLRSDRRVNLRSSGSDWVEVKLSPEDLDFALDLLRDAAEANLLSAPQGAPPQGAELKRRRRFH